MIAMEFSRVKPDDVVAALTSMPEGLTDDEIKDALADIYHRIGALGRHVDITAGTLLRIEKALARLTP
jgi:hypothetical protein